MIPINKSAAPRLFDINTRMTHMILQSKPTIQVLIGFSQNKATLAKCCDIVTSRDLWPSTDLGLMIVTALEGGQNAATTGPVLTI